MGVGEVLVMSPLLGEEEEEEELQELQRVYFPLFVDLNNKASKMN